MLAEGAFPVCSAGDVLVALSLAGADVPSPKGLGHLVHVERRHA